jgi:transcriptional regulator with XRE-family HTH domain
MDIKAIRESLGMSQADFAALLGVAMVRLRRAERSLADLPTTALAPLAALANLVPPDRRLSETVQLLHTNLVNRANATELEAMRQYCTRAADQYQAIATDLRQRHMQHTNSMAAIPQLLPLLQRPVQLEAAKLALMQAERWHQPDALDLAEQFEQMAEQLRAVGAPPAAPNTAAPGLRSI